MGNSEASGGGGGGGNNCGAETVNSGVMVEVAVIMVVMK